MRNLIALSVIFAFALAGCATAPKATPTPTPTKTEAPAPVVAPAPAPTAAPVADPSSIVAGDTGFSPLAQTPHNYLTFSLHFGRPDILQTWMVEWTRQDGTVVHTVKGDASRLPPTLTWDGNADDGTPAAEGTYQARLSVDYGTKGGVATSTTDTFLLDITPPSGTISVTPQPYELGDANIMDHPTQVTFEVHVVPGLAPVTSWRLAVVHPNGTRFMDFISEQHKDNVVAWNARAQNNASLEGGTTYNLTAQVFDRYGNSGILKGTLAVKAAPMVPAQAAPVTVSVDGNLVASTQIYFPAFSSDLSQVGSAKKSANEQALDTLAAALKVAPGAKIRVVGHANKVFWQDEVKGAREQKETLIPLSKARAEAVRDALVGRGLNAASFELTGVGADGAQVDFGDVVNNWKNRWVEFAVQTQ